MSTGSYSYQDEDTLLAWLYEVDDEVRFLNFLDTLEGTQMGSQRVRHAMRTLAGFGLANCDLFRQRRTGCETGMAEITGDGIIVIREHSGKVSQWRMFGRDRGNIGATTVTTHNQIVKGDVTNSQLAQAGSTAEQQQQTAGLIGGADIASLIQAVRNLVGQLSVEHDRNDEIEDALLRVATLVEDGPDPETVHESRAPVQRRLERVAALLESARGDRCPDEIHDVVASLREAARR